MSRAYDDVIPPTSYDDDPALQQFALAVQEHFEEAYRLSFGLGETLAQRRRELQLSQTDLARVADVPQAEISRIERGKGNPTLATIGKLLAALCLSLDVQPIHPAPQ